MSDEQRISALRDEIRGAGRGTRVMRRWTFGWLVAPLLGLELMMVAIVYSGKHLAPPAPPKPTLGNIARDVAQATGWGVLPGLLISVTTALVYRRVRRAQLRRRLIALPPAERAAVLLPLRSEQLGDTRVIVVPLLREFGVPAEVTPAAPPDVHGDEASPAER